MRPDARFILVIAPLLSVLAAAQFSHFVMPMPVYWQAAVDLSNHGRITQQFTPAGYPVFLVFGFLAKNAQLGVEVVQTMLHVGITILLYGLSLSLGVNRIPALMTACAVQLHPELLLGVFKVWDVSLSTFFLLLFVALGAIIIRSAKHAWHYELALGLSFGAGVFLRPNYALLLPCLIWLLWRATPRETWVTSGQRVAAAMFAALILYAFLSAAAFRALVWPGNGPYNLYAGQNALSERALLEDMNAEPSIALSLRANGMAQAAVNPYDLALEPYYTHEAASFAESHPVEELSLIGVKLFTFLRPYTKANHNAAKYVLALPIPIWLAVLIWRRSRLQPVDGFVIGVAVLYVVPFLVTNSDPRFRTPLDVVLIVHAAALIGWRRESENSPPSRS